jgi:hypothetical protein
VVSEPATAATVIESWTRNDVAAPLLAARPLPASEDEVADTAVVAAARPAAQGIQLLAAEETSVASDGTVWAGAQIGACIMLGPICAAAQLHGGKLIGRSERWRGFTGHLTEIYVGIEVPIAVGPVRVTPGFAAGYGSIFTRSGAVDVDDDKMGVEVSGPRAEIHAALSIPLTAHIALDVRTSAALTQATEREIRGSGGPDVPDVPAPAIVFPGEPRALFRLALGVRYGAL